MIVLWWHWCLYVFSFSASVPNIISQMIQRFSRYIMPKLVVTHVRYTHNAKLSLYFVSVIQLQNKIRCNWGWEGLKRTDILLISSGPWIPYVFLTVFKLYRFDGLSNRLERKQLNSCTYIFFLRLTFLNTLEKNIYILFNDERKSPGKCRLYPAFFLYRISRVRSWIYGVGRGLVLRVFGPERPRAVRRTPLPLLRHHRGIDFQFHLLRPPRPLPDLVIPGHQIHHLHCPRRADQQPRPDHHFRSKGTYCIRPER